MRSLLGELDDEWSELAGRERGRWPGLPRDLGALVAQARKDGDGPLRILLSALRDGDGLAGRVALQVLLPVVGSAVRRGAEPEEAVAETWLLLAEYPLERRPRAIAANVALDLRKALGRQRRRETRLRGAVVELGVAGSRPVAEEPDAARVLAHAERLGLVGDETAAVLRSVYLDGLPGRVAAARHGLSEPAVRQRCSQAVRRLATHRLELLAA